MDQASDDPAGSSSWTPMGIVDGVGKSLRATRSPHPGQRRAARVMTGGAIAFVLAIVVLALVAGR